MESTSFAFIGSTNSGRRAEAVGFDFTSVTGSRFGATTQGVVYLTEMREILEIEEHVPIPPMIYSDPFYRITHLIKEEIRKYKWIEGEKGRKLSWEEARKEWTDAYQEKYEKFLIETLYIPNANLERESSAPKDNST
jgi:hypothetical protein